MNCPECHALVGPEPGPTHAYIPAPAGCWKVYGEVLALQYSNKAYWPAHRLTVDAYSAQHASGVDSRQIQSVMVHLSALYLTLVKKVPEEKVRRAMEFVIGNYRGQFPAVRKPDFKNTLTIVDVAKASSPEHHLELVHQWASSVWEAWKDSHPVIEDLFREKGEPLLRM